MCREREQERVEKSFHNFPTIYGRMMRFSPPFFAGFFRRSSSFDLGTIAVDSLTFFVFGTRAKKKTLQPKN